MQPFADLARLNSMESMHETEDSHKHADSGIDLQAVLAMAGGDLALLRELAGAFLDEVPRLLRTLRSAIDTRDTESLQAAAHQLQGVMRCLHIERALQQARQLELLGQAGTDWPAAKELLAELGSTIDSATNTLTEFLGEQA
jgi:HPt (histidine-containing phosphotransfer) domain-containing protein